MTKPHNTFSVEADNSASFLKRFFIYQKERFPLLGHGLLVTTFSFSAISYSRICRGESGFVSLSAFLTGIFTTITLFLLVRIFDEFKDREDDAKYRPELPVPRGLIGLNELKILGIVLVILQIVINWWLFPGLLVLYAAVIVYLLLMGKEFFVASWLKKHQFWYVVSHMFIIPLIDMYASGVDWLLDGVQPPSGLIYFFVVSYLNGIVLETGRKIRIPEKEAEGVLTYSAMLGMKKAVYLWLAVLILTLVAAVAAAFYAGHGAAGWISLCSVFAVCLIPAMRFLYKPTLSGSKMLEYASALWTIAMYFILGGIPMMRHLIF